MDYLTMEVEIDHGKVSPKGPLPLPEKATGLLTIFSPTPPESKPAPFLQTLETLQKHLGLSEDGVQKWLDAVYAARGQRRSA
jgi:hypothetical protein